MKNAMVKRISVALGAFLTVLAFNAVSAASFVIVIYQPKAPKSLLIK